MYCKHCGASIPEGSVFCSACGKSQTGGAAGQTSGQKPVGPVQPPVYTVPAKWTNTGLIIAICTLGVLAAAALVFAGITLFSAPKDEAAGFADVYDDLIASSDIGTSAESSLGVDPTQEPAEPTQAPTQMPTQAPAEAPTQVPDDTNDHAELDAILAAGLVPDIESYVDQTWWASSGHEIDNPNAVAVASGYPKVYDLAYGDIQYIFDTDLQIVTAVYEQDGAYEEQEQDYNLDPAGFFLYSFHRTVAIDGVDHEIYSAFFASGDKLYEVELIDGTEVSNYIELELYGP